MDMNTKMNEMMEAMMGSMMEKMMESMMNSMMNSMMGTVSPAEAVTEAPKATKKQALTKEEFLAMEFTEKPKAVTDYSNLDFICPTEKSCCYNMGVSTDIWNYTDMVAREKYNCTGCYKREGQFRWNFATSTDCRNFLQSFEIKTEFTGVEKAQIAKYKADKKASKAQAYLNKYNEDYNHGK